MSLKYTTVPSKRLADSITASATSFRLSDTLGWDGDALADADFGTQAFAIFRDVNSTVMEIMEIDPTTIDASAITIVRRGLNFDGDLTTEDSARKLTWVKGTTIVEIGAAAPQHFQFLKEYIDGIAISGSPNASTTAKGIVEEATQAEVDAGTAAGGTAARLFVNPTTVRAKKFNDYVVDTGVANTYAIAPSPAITAYAAGQVFVWKAVNANTAASTLNVNSLGAVAIKSAVGGALIGGEITANSIIMVVHNGTDFNVVTSIGGVNPRTLNFISKTFGSSTTQFDITNPSGSTMRYTWDSTGTDPAINGYTVPLGTVLNINGQNFSANNNVTGAIVTGVGTNYFEISNSSGVAEDNKTLGSGSITPSTTWTKPTGLTYVEVEVQAGGGGGATTDTLTGGGGAGGYARRRIPATSLGATETITVGTGGTAGSPSPLSGGNGSPSSFGTLCTAAHGTGGSPGGGGTGGEGTLGDITLKGGNGRRTHTINPSPSVSAPDVQGLAFLGYIGAGGDRGAVGGAGRVIVHEHYDA